ncbi:hypothetical protein EVAR_98285_1 [Eumeta japonica]|uniref:Uncharacterized protein n=1 Tax=Eumeta variegata TaxID=151549 RepID=A0A4C1XDI5_EUMVA|nr:hypothetical protein EVAR_98285_1 [Eumeta japonica]
MYQRFRSSSNPKKYSESMNLNEESSSKQCDLDSDDDDFMEDESKGELHMITPSELHDLMRDLQLSKAKSELLASRL